jgi:CheY-like chemotaxis protein
MRVLAFEDTYDLTVMLDAAGCDLSGVNLIQRWNSNEPLKHIIEHKPDVVLLDYFMPPHTGLEVLQMLNAAIDARQISRPHLIIGISSEGEANEELAKEGADACVIKFDIHTLDLWNMRG